LWFQVLPLVGAFSVPLMCLINYLFYRRLFERRVRKAEWPGWSAPALAEGSGAAGELR